MNSDAWLVFVSAIGFVTVPLAVLLTQLWKVEDRLKEIIELLKERLPNDNS